MQVKTRLEKAERKKMSKIMSAKRGQHLFLRLNLGQLIVRAMALKEAVTRDGFFRSQNSFKSRCFLCVS